LTAFPYRIALDVAPSLANSLVAELTPSSLPAVWLGDSMSCGLDLTVGEPVYPIRATLDSNAAQSIRVLATCALFDGGHAGIAPFLRELTREDHCRLAASVASTRAAEDRALSG